MKSGRVATQAATHAGARGSRPPRVSIGLPVFNGERYLASTIESVLAQTFTDFELIVTDNASIDRTAEICREYAARDQRVRYHRNETNLGLSGNYTRAFRLARGRYFRWQTYDDPIASDFVEKCVAALDADPSVVLAHSKSARIDERGRAFGAYDYDMRVDSPLAEERFRDLVTVRHSCNESLGLMRADVLRRTPLQANYVGSDRVLLAEMGLRGRFHIVPEYLFFRRDHPGAGSNIPLQQRSEWFDPARAGRVRMPQCREVFEYARAVGRVPLPLRTRRACYAALARYAFARRRRLVAELSDGAKKSLLRLSVVRLAYLFVKGRPRPVAGEKGVS